MGATVVEGVEGAVTTVPMVVVGDAAVPGAIVVGAPVLRRSADERSISQAVSSRATAQPTTRTKALVRSLARAGANTSLSSAN